MLRIEVEKPSLVLIQGGREEPPVRTAPPKGGYCQHAGVEVDTNARTVKCVKCAATLDPIAVIQRWARDGDSLRHMWRQEEEQRKRIEQLSEAEKKLKAKVRSWKEKIPPELLSPEERRERESFQRYREERRARKRA